MSSPATASSPTPFDSGLHSTAASSPPASEGLEPEEETTLEDKESSLSRACQNDFETRFTRLQFLLKKSSMYAKMLSEQMERGKQQAREALQEASPKVKGKRKQSTKKTGEKRAFEDSDNDEEGSSKRQKVEGSAVTAFKQPSLVTGATLKDYQLEGVEWMISLDQNGVSGILADEMGLTLQTIAFNAYLREKGHGKPFLVVCPLSVLHNWVEEFNKFAPTIPVCMYHGTPDERAELRTTVMKPITDLDTTAKTKAQKANAKRGRKTGRKGGKKAAPLPKKGKGRGKPPAADDEEESEVDVEDEESKTADDMDQADTFPVVITTYEMIIRDRIQLAAYDWGYIVVDEGHRLKNLDCKLMQEIKKYPSAGRMILTGTPLHNNLAELWSLLNFILPDIFNDLDSFQEWFNLPTMQSNISSAHALELIHSLHAILKPFLLRRMKVDVAKNLPPKKEYVLYAPLTMQQRTLYDSIVSGTLRAHLIKEGGGGDEAKQDDAAEDLEGPRRMRSDGKRTDRKRYAVDGDDDEYFEKLESGELEAKALKENDEKARKQLERLGRDYQKKAALKKVNNMKLQNTIMQLRKVCSHPFLFDWPLDQHRQPVLDKNLVDASGKMMVLDRLLTELFRTKHKVLLFSQFVTMLDIIEDWATEFKGWTICRIDGSTSPLDRRAQMEAYQTGGDAPEAPILFLLSTRAGGLGINLTAADTVIFYDQDWNPQMDAQAQDRAHRIGQTQPVLIFRIVSARTIETKIMSRANEKRKLEALVIAKGKFKMPATAAGRAKPPTTAEMAASLLKIEGESMDVVSSGDTVINDKDLQMLLDRRLEVFAGRTKGWTSAGDGTGDSESGETKAAFAVYDAPVDEGNDMLAQMLAEQAEQS